MFSASAAASPPPLPGFLFRPTLPAGFIPTSVATGDFNGDGRMDWVVANGGDNDLWLYLGNGDGTSQLPTIIPLTGQSPIAVTAADLRGNGVLDLIVAEADTQTVGVLLGNGNGTFSTETEYPISETPLCLLTNDFNGDGHPDILVGLQGGSQQPDFLALLPGDGTGGLGAPVYTAPDPNSGEDPKIVANIAMADLNNDGHPDIVLNDVGGISKVVAYLNQGDGAFGGPEEISVPSIPGSSPTNLALGDLNSDGCSDLVILDTLDLAERYLGNCDGTFQAGSPYTAFGIGEIGYGIALADVNGDGRLDLVSSGYVADLPGAYGWQSGHLVSVLLGNGQGGFSPPVVYRGEPGMYSLAVADLSGNGYPDIITANQDTDSVSVFKNDNHGGFGMPQGGYIGYFVNGVTGGEINTPLTGLVAQDLNRDGKLDLSLIEAPSPGSNCLGCADVGALLNQGNGIFAQAVHSDLPSGTFAGITDFDFDDFRNTGLPDLIFDGSDLSSGALRFSFAPNMGNGAFGAGTSELLDENIGTLRAGDFNGDGKLDFVSVGAVTGSEPNTVTQVLTVFLGDGTGNFTPGYSTRFNVNSNIGMRGLWVGDFNGDGKLDVLIQEGWGSAGTLGHDIYEFLGNGDGTFGSPQIVLTDAGPIAVGDLNHDGRPDIVEQVEPLTTLPIGLPPQYAIYLAQPNGSFTLTNTYQPYAGVVNDANADVGGPILGDFNGDGNLDIIVYQSPFDNPLGYEPDSYFQVLAGNGDGTFTPTYTIFNITTASSPQFAADVTGDGRTDLIELDTATSSYHVIPAAPGPAMQIRLVSDPVVGTNDNLQINLALASASSTTINLSASDPAITIPSSVTIPAGSSSLDVPFQINSTFNPKHVFSIQAQLGSDTETAYGTQATGLGGFRLALNGSMTVAAGGTTSDYGLGIFSLDGYSTTVQLQCAGLPAGATCKFGDTSVQVPGGGIGGTSLVVATSSSLPAGNYPFTVIATDGTVSGQSSAAVNVVQGPAIEISPESLTFPMQTVGTTSTPQAVTITNTGSAAMTISISLGGAAGAANTSFAQTNNCGTGVAPGGSCNVNVTFTPTATGSVTGSLLIDANTTGATRQYVTLSGTVEGAMVKTSPSSLNFNNEYVGATSVPQSVTVWNTGTVPINFSGITIGGSNPADFTVATGSNCSSGTALGVGLGCVINITFAPSEPGTRTATLSIADNAGSVPQTVSLSGTADAPDFELGVAPGASSSATITAGESATYSLEVVPLGAFNQTVRLSCPGAPSLGTCTVSPSSVTLSGSGAVKFSVRVTTSAPTLAAPREPGPPGPPPVGLWAALLGLGALAWFLARGTSLGKHRIPDPLRTPGYNRPRYVLALGAVLLAVTLWASCGGGGGGANTKASSPGTPTGSYALLVSGTSGSTSHSLDLTLKVN